jgi:hypothetical protein
LRSDSQEEKQMKRVIKETIRWVAILRMPHFEGRSVRASVAAVLIVAAASRGLLVGVIHGNDIGRDHGLRRAEVTKESNESEDPVTVKYDRFDDETTVYLHLTKLSSGSPTFSIGSNDSFKGHTPSDYPQRVSFYFDNLDYSSGSNVLLVDDERIELGTLDKDQWLHVPIPTVAAMASGREVEARIGHTEFTLSDEHKKAIRDYLARLTPEGEYDRQKLDAPRLNRWSIGRTVAYVNNLLRMRARASDQYEHIAVDDEARSLTNFVSQRSPDTAEGYGDFQKWQADVAFLDPNDASVDYDVALIGCRNERKCVVFSQRSEDNDWRYFDSHDSLQLRVKAATLAEKESLKNAVIYLVMLLQKS